jgi:protein-S-isoprenylcysteine O-methyltransferase Ste14
MGRGRDRAPCLSIFMSDRSDTPPIIAPPPILLFACILVAWALNTFFPLELSIPFAARVIIGNTLLVVSIAFAIPALLVMHRANTPAEPWKPTVRIVASGPFRFTRNPIYVAMILVFAAIAVFTASPWFFAFLPVLFLLLNFGVVRAEEQYLSSKFGEEYVSYMRRVRRWP